MRELDGQLAGRLAFAVDHSIRRSRRRPALHRLCGSAPPHAGRAAGPRRDGVQALGTIPIRPPRQRNPSISLSPAS